MVHKYQTPKKYNKPNQPYMGRLSFPTSNNNSTFLHTPRDLTKDSLIEEHSIKRWINKVSHSSHQKSKNVPRNSSNKNIRIPSLQSLEDEESEIISTQESLSDNKKDTSIILKPRVSSPFKNNVSLKQSQHQQQQNLLQTPSEPASSTQSHQQTRKFSFRNQNISKSFISYPSFAQPTTTQQQEKKASQKRYRLVLDMDETLIHSLDINDKEEVKFFTRTYCLEFLKNMHKYFEIFVFTAAQQDYADAILDTLDFQGFISKRLYRAHMKEFQGNLVKDLTVLGKEDLSKTILVDNLRENFGPYPENGYEISNFFGNVSDIELFKLEILLMEIVNQQCDDVRIALGQKKQIFEENKQKINEFQKKFAQKDQGVDLTHAIAVKIKPIKSEAQNLGFSTMLSQLTKTKIIQTKGDQSQQQPGDWLKNKNQSEQLVAEENVSASNKNIQTSQNPKTAELLFQSISEINIKLPIQQQQQQLPPKTQLNFAQNKQLPQTNITEQKEINPTKRRMTFQLPQNSKPPLQRPSTSNINNNSNNNNNSLPLSIVKKVGSQQRLSNSKYEFAKQVQSSFYETHTPKH